MFTIDMINQDASSQDASSQDASSQDASSQDASSEKPYESKRQTSVVVYKKGKPIINISGSLKYVYNPETKTINKIRSKERYQNIVCYKNNIYCLESTEDDTIEDTDDNADTTEQFNSINISSVLSVSHMAYRVNNDNLYISGGFEKNENPFLRRNNTLIETKRCYKYSFEKNNIEEIVSLPTSLYGHSMVSIDNKLYIIGGCSIRVFLKMSSNNILVYDTEQEYIQENKWDIVNPVNSIKSTSRHKHCSVVCDNKIYSIGGISQKTIEVYREPENDEDYNNYSWKDVVEPLLSVECFDPKTLVLSYVAPLPYEMTDMTAVSVKMSKIMIRNEITSKPIYSELYNLITLYVKDKWITDTIFEYIITEKIYIFKEQKVLSYIPEFNEWVEEI
jgi:hypothetical protein